MPPTAMLVFSSTVMMLSSSATPAKVSISKFPCSLTRKMTPHSMKNLDFHSLFSWKMIILPFSVPHLYRRTGRRNRCKDRDRYVDRWRQTNRCDRRSDGQTDINRYTDGDRQSDKQTGRQTETNRCTDGVRQIVEQTGRQIEIIRCTDGDRQIVGRTATDLFEWRWGACSRNAAKPGRASERLPQ